ncbi:MAG: hypothetical protein PHE52_01395 [Candidatus Pacebacteria bacterium]|nr:hypothetical protein [Candidatus Paceibacterota bacterium]
MNKNHILLIIGVLILMGIASYLGYQMSIKATSSETKIVPPPFLTSTVIQKWSAVAQGKVTDIAGRNLVLIKNEETLAIPISETAKIYRVDVTQEVEKPEEVSFEDIKIGDEVGVPIEIIAGRIEGSSVTILSQ